MNSPRSRHRTPEYNGSSPDSFKAMNSLMVVDVTDVHGNVIDALRLAGAETVHRQLRPALPDSYADRMREIFASGGRMAVALTNGEAVAGVAVWRVFENTAHGRVLYVDDLITDAAQRSRGVGKALLDHLDARSRALGCDLLSLDSGTHRTEAHRFYFRERMSVTSFHFAKPVK